MTGESLLLLGFLLNLLFAIVIVRGLYCPKMHSQEFSLTFIVFNSIVYIVMILFTAIPLMISAGFGLFALFSILLYSTKSVPIREMTYLFVMVTIPMINAFFFENGQYSNFIISDLLIIGLIGVLEKTSILHYEDRKKMVYERIELIHEDRREEMIKDLISHTKLRVSRVEVNSINYVKNIAEITVFYNENPRITRVRLKKRKN